MSAVDERHRYFGQFCIGCGSLLLADQPCSTCGADSKAAPADDDSLELSVNLSVLHCDRCGNVMSIGTLVCPTCGDSVDPGEPTDPREAPLNRMKLEALGDLLPMFYELTSIAAEEQVSSSLVTDDQFLSYLNRHSIISAHLLIGNLKELVRDVDLSDEAAIRSPETRGAFEGILKTARELRAIYNELQSVRAPEQLSELHLQAIVAFQTAIDLHVTCARAILALTVEELQATKRELQVAVDRLSVICESMLTELAQADHEAVGLHRIERRLGAFARQSGQYEHGGRPDLAAVLVAGLDEHKDFARLGHVGAACFGQMLLVDPSSLPPEQGLVLYVLAAQVAASDDPLTLRRWSNVLLDVLNEAFHRDPAAMASAAVAADVDTEEAMVHLLSVGDTLRSIRVDELSIEAIRQQLTTSYLTLVEWSHRRLLNLLLAAKFILRGKPKPYQDIAAAGFGTKYDWLAKSPDPRYAPAFIHVSVTIRHAGAHGDVDTSGPKIRLFQRDKHDRTKIVGVEELTEDEFGDRLRDLLLTCDALRLSAELFRIEHYHELPLPGLPTRPRVITEVARVFVGYFGLVRAEIDFTGLERVVVAAEEDERVSTAPYDYLTAAFTLATLFRSYTTVELQVMRDGDRKCRIEAPVAEVLAQQDLPEDVRTYYLLKLCYLSSVEPHDDSPHERYMKYLVQAGSRLLMQDLAAAQQLRAELPKTKRDYTVSVEVLIQKLGMLANVLRTVEPPATAALPRDSLLIGLESLMRGLREHQRLMRSGRWAAVGRRSHRLEKGARIVVRWSS